MLPGRGVPTVARADMTTNRFLFLTLSTLTLGCSVREAPSASVVPIGSSIAEAGRSAARAGEGGRYRFVRIKHVGELEHDFYRGPAPKVPSWIHVVLDQPARPSEEPQPIARVFIDKTEGAARQAEFLAFVKKNAHEVDDSCELMLGPALGEPSFDSHEVGGIEVHRVCASTAFASLKPKSVVLDCTGEDVGPGDPPAGAYLMVTFDDEAVATLEREFGAASWLGLVVGTRLVGGAVDRLNADHPNTVAFWAGKDGAAGAKIHGEMTGVEPNEGCEAP